MGSIFSLKIKLRFKIHLISQGLALCDKMDMYYNNSVNIYRKNGGINLKKVIATSKAPGAIGPYSQAIMTGNLIYTSGQLPMDAETGEMVANDIVLQTRKSLQNVKAILEEAGSSMDKIVKTTVYLSDMANFGKMNEVYKEFFTGDYPARSAFQVARLPKDALVEIEVVAIV